MAKGEPDNPPSPFAPAPSARPPSAEQLRVLVRVPAPGRTAEAHAPTEHAIHVDAEKTSDTIPAPAAVAIRRGDVSPEVHDGGDEPPASSSPAIRPPPPAMPETASPPLVAASARKGTALLVATAGGALLLGGAGAVFLLTRSPPERRGTTTREEPPSSTAAPSSSAWVSPSVEDSSSASASASSPPSAAQSKPFDRGAAKAALDALTPRVLACKPPKGSLEVKVTFAPDGTVASTTPAPPLAGTAPATCVATALKKAHVPAFSGPPIVFVQSVNVK